MFNVLGIEGFTRGSSSFKMLCTAHRYESIKEIMELSIEYEMGLYVRGMPSNAIASYVVCDTDPTVLSIMLEHYPSMILDVLTGYLDPTDPPLSAFMFNRLSTFLGAVSDRFLTTALSNPDLCHLLEQDATGELLGTIVVRRYWNALGWESLENFMDSTINAAYASGELYTLRLLLRMFPSMPPVQTRVDIDRLLQYGPIQVNAMLAVYTDAMMAMCVPDCVRDLIHTYITPPITIVVDGAGDGDCDGDGDSDGDGGGGGGDCYGDCDGGCNVDCDEKSLCFTTYIRMLFATQTHISRGRAEYRQR